MGIESKAVSKLGIKYVKGGPPELMQAMNEVINGLDRLVPHSTPDIVSAVTAHGTTHRLARIPPRPVAGTAAAALPLQITDASVLTGTPVAKISVTYGIVNASAPSIGGTSISIVPAPLMTLASAGTWLIYLDSTGTVTVISSVIGTQPADTSSHTYNTLGEADVIASGGGFIVSAIRNAKVSSLTCQNCSGSNWNWGQQ